MKYDIKAENLCKQIEKQKQIIEHYQECYTPIKASVSNNYSQSRIKGKTLRLMKELQSLKGEQEQSEREPVYKHNIGSTTQFNVETKDGVKDTDDEPPKHPTSWRDFTMTDKEPKVGVKESQSAEEMYLSYYGIEKLPHHRVICDISEIIDLMEQYHKEQTREELKSFYLYVDDKWALGMLTDKVDEVVDEYLKNK